mmetsp:Transcript_53815/g.149364  ORF Transcript_53815/g.149364 Transcript_53815/m.149364 type:complete len:252 (+) Transcript_53815:1324-2079(+)
MQVVTAPWYRQTTLGALAIRTSAHGRASTSQWATARTAGTAVSATCHTPRGLCAWTSGTGRRSRGCLSASLSASCCPCSKRRPSAEARRRKTREMRVLWLASRRVAGLSWVAQARRPGAPPPIGRSRRRGFPVDRGPLPRRTRGPRPVSGRRQRSSRRAGPSRQRPGPWRRGAQRSKPRICWTPLQPSPRPARRRTPVELPARRGPSKSGAHATSTGSPTPAAPVAARSLEYLTTRAACGGRKVSWAHWRS